MTSKLRPIQNRVVAEFIKAEENKTAGGIFLPDTADKDKPQIAKVLAVGSGEEVQKEIKVGDEIIFSKYAGTEIKYDNETYLLLKLEDISAVVEK